MKRCVKQKEDEIEKQNEYMEIHVIKNSEKEQVDKEKIENLQANVKEKEEFIDSQEKRVDILDKMILDKEGSGDEST